MIIEKARANFRGGFYDIFLNLKEKPEDNFPFEVTGTPTVIFSSHDTEYYAVQRKFTSKEDAKSFFESVRLALPHLPHAYREENLPEAKNTPQKSFETLHEVSK